MYILLFAFIILAQATQEPSIVYLSTHFTPKNEKKSIKQKAQRIRIRDTWSQHNVIRSNFQIVDKNLPGKIETFDYYTR